MDLIPPDDRVLVRLHTPGDSTLSGLWRPQDAREAPVGDVVAVGAGVRDRNGRIWPSGLDVGDVVILPPQVGGSEIETDDGDVVVSILASQVLARVIAVDF